MVIIPGLALAPHPEEHPLLPPPDEMVTVSSERIKSITEVPWKGFPRLLKTRVLSSNEVAEKEKPVAKGWSVSPEVGLGITFPEPSVI